MGTKISRDGTVSDSAAIVAAADGEQPAELEEQEHPGTGEPMTGTEDPADGTMAEISSEPAGADETAPDAAPAAEAPAPAAPVAPPRRVPPGGGNG